jgi:hypothetical protein
VQQGLQHRHPGRARGLAVVGGAVHRRPRGRLVQDQGGAVVTRVRMLGARGAQERVGLLDLVHAVQAGEEAGLLLDQLGLDVGGEDEGSGHGASLGRRPGRPGR